MTISAVVLAAGLGSRFGGRKLMAQWRGRSLLQSTLQVAASAPTENIIVVTGAFESDVRRLVHEWQMQNGYQDLSVAHNEAFLSGMSSSLRTGIRALPPDSEAAFIFLGDMPSVPESILPKLCHALVPGKLAAAPICGGQRGHPVLVTRALFPRFEKLEGDQGARSILCDLGEKLALVETSDQGVLFDIDTKERLT